MADFPSERAINAASGAEDAHRRAWQYHNAETYHSERIGKMLDAAYAVDRPPVLTPEERRRLLQLIADYLRSRDLAGWADFIGSLAGSSR